LAVREGVQGGCRDYGIWVTGKPFQMCGGLVAPGIAECDSYVAKKSGILGAPYGRATEAIAELLLR
jgi:hypothetical protein